MVSDLYFRKLTLGAAWEIDLRKSRSRHSETLKLHSRKKMVKTLNGLEAAREQGGLLRNGVTRLYECDY